VRARGPLLQPASHDRGGAARYRWRARVALRGVTVTAATKLIIELHAAQLPVGTSTMNAISNRLPRHQPDFHPRFLTYMSICDVSGIITTHTHIYVFYE